MLVHGCGFMRGNTYLFYNWPLTTNQLEAQAMDYTLWNI